MNLQHKAIEIIGLKKTFRTGLKRKRSVALHGLDLSVNRGEVFGFLGPNGAGKTTTIKIMVGLLKADGGQVRVNGIAANDVRARQKVAYLPEFPDLYDYLKPSEFLKHCAELSGLDKKRIQQRVPELLELVGLDPQERRVMRKFSKGMLQRVGIAQTMLADPDLYILDEPMGGLDPIGRRWVKDLIAQLGASGKTVFFSSHVLAEAEAVCSRVAFIHRGKIIKQGPVRELLNDESAAWEVLLADEQAMQDDQLDPLVSQKQLAGTHTLLLLPSKKQLQPVLTLIDQKKYSILSINRQHMTLEDVFIQLMDKNQERSA